MQSQETESLTKDEEDQNETITIIMETLVQRYLFIT